MSKNDAIEVTEGSGNVFADLGFADPDLELLKSTMVERIASVIRTRKLTQVQAAEILGLDQPKISALLRGRFGGYSTDRLLRFLTALDQDVQLIMKATYLAPRSDRPPSKSSRHNYQKADHYPFARRIAPRPLKPEARFRPRAFCKEAQRIPVFHYPLIQRGDIKPTRQRFQIGISNCRQGILLIVAEHRSGPLHFLLLFFYYDKPTQVKATA